MEVKGKFSFPHERVVPPKGRMNKDLVDWYPRKEPTSTTRFYSECNAPATRPFSPVSIGKRPEVQAMFQSLENIEANNQVSVDFTAETTEEVEAGLINRIYELPQTLTSTVIFTITDVVLSSANGLVLTCDEE